MTLALRGAWHRGAPPAPLPQRAARPGTTSTARSGGGRRDGARAGPEWFVRLAPPVVGLVACAVATERRRAIAENLRRVRGRRGPGARGGRRRAHVRHVRVVPGRGPRRRAGPAAGCVAAIVRGELHLEDALALGRGVILVTAHTAGWEVVGPLLARDRRVAGDDRRGGRARRGGERHPGRGAAHARAARRARGRRPALGASAGQGTCATAARSPCRSTARRGPPARTR